MTTRLFLRQCLLTIGAVAFTSAALQADERPLTRLVEQILGVQRKSAVVKQPVARKIEVEDVAEESLIGTEVEAAADNGAENNATEDESAEDMLPTHAESGVIEVKTASGCSLNSFCVSPEGHIYAACGNPAKSNGQIEVFTADGKPLHTWTVPVVTQAINFTPDGKLFVAGEGEIALIGKDGKVVTKWATPNAADVEKNASEIIERTIASRREMYARYAEYAKNYETQMKSLQKTPDPSDNIQRRIDTLKRQIEVYRQLGETSDEQLKLQAKASLKAKMKVSALGLTDKDVYIACSATEGYGFDVWRTDHQLQNAEKIITGLRGCCGQMDIQCCKGEVFVAENARHRVCRYSRDGKLLSTFGERAREGSAGFGSCCNPMNLRFGANGELYTSESSIGRIKKYTVDGELVSVVGKAKIVPGCKNVSIGLSPKGDRVYMMDLTRSRIVIMSGPTADEAPKAVSQLSTETR